jgi:hydrogenase-4 component F
VNWLLIALIAAPLLATVGSLVAPPRIGHACTVLGGGAALVIAVALAQHISGGSSLHIVNGWLGLDPLGAVFLLPTAFLYAISAVYSVGYMGAEQRDGYAGFARRYLAYLNLFCLTMLLVPLATDFASLWIAVELTTIVSALLVALDRTDAALEAAWKYVLIASAGLGIALMGLILLYAAGTGPLGGGHVPRFADYLSVAGRLHPDLVKVAFLLAAVGFGTKAGLAPMHTWLPDAHSEAPTPISALLSGSLLASAFYAILRFYQVTIAADGHGFPNRVLIVFGVVSLAVAAVFVIRQENYKRLLAYSSIEHIGVIALGIGFGSPLAIFGALLHVLSHAAAKGLAFFGAGSILRRYDTKLVANVGNGIGVLPWSGPMFLIAGLGLSGLPVSAVFRSEFQVVSAGFANPSYVGVACLIILVNIAFFGVIWHVGRMTLSPREVGAPQPRGETSWWMAGAMVACLVVLVGLGLHVPGSLSDLLSHATNTLHGSRGGR